MSRRFDSSVNGLKIIFNHNVGGVAGGFNRGVDAAIAEGVDWITLLDQDSRLSLRICSGFVSHGRIWIFQP